MGPKPTLGLRILASLGNEGSSCKRFKMRCLQMPLFWFMSFVHGIKRIRDKTFCFDIWLGPNLCTRKVTWDSYFRIATFVTWEMSNDRFTIPKPILPIANKRQLTILELLKKKKQIKVLLWAQTANKQRCSYELKKNKQIRMLLQA